MLRLEHLFEQYDYHVPQDNPWHARAAVRALLDIASILARADIKSELLKEMDRYHLSLARMANLPDIDPNRLQHILQNLRQIQQGLQGVHGQLGIALRNSDFLNAVLQRSAIPGGGFDFDLPQLHYWLSQPHSERLVQFDDWRNEVAPVHEAVELLLSLIRHSTTFSPCQANAGFYQRSLPSGASVHMIQVRLAEESRLFAEISGGKHRFSIRFMEGGDLEHPVQTELNVAFDLNISII
jgi:cell division protein ZapD